MSVSAAPAEHLEVQARWKSAQMVSKCRQDRDMCQADDALSSAPMAVRQSRCSAPMAVLRSATEEENEAMEEVADLMGAADVSAMAAVGTEGLLAMPLPAGFGVAPNTHATQVGRAAGGGADTVDGLLDQLRVEPRDETECAAKFLLYEGYGAEVEELRGSLIKFHQENRPTVPEAIARDMDKQVTGIDSQEAMGIPDRAREWFVFHMMRQAQKNNFKMASILESFEKKLELLATINQVECPVCLENFSDVGPHSAETLACCRKVCKDCWGNWSVVTGGRPFCPLCRHEEFLGAVASRLG